MTLDTLIDAIGWVGSIELILAYGLLSYGKIRSDSWTYQLLNLTAGICLIIYTGYLTAYANTFLNTVWVIIAVIAIIKLMRKR